METTERTLREKIAQQLKDRRLNYRDFEGVSDETCEALSAWIMDVINERKTVDTNG